MKAYLILENGQVFEGESIGSQKEVISEFVFNTSMTGYLEVLTDPSYYGQSVIMTYPLIGNYGVCLEDQESNASVVKGFVVNELARAGSNFRKDMELEDYLIERDIPGIQGIDTRYLTQVIRNQGSMNGMITTNLYENLEEILPKIKEFKIENAVEATTCKESYNVGDGKIKVAVYDLGLRKNIVNTLVEKGCSVTVYPAFTSAKTILDGGYDGVVLSNGPGDPQELTTVIEEVKILMDCNIPMFGICLGHQVIALANDFKTVKMKYGHHGVNHPVKNLETGRVYITTQNHNFMVSDDSVDETIAQPWFKNVNDKTIEGLVYKNKNIRTVQFHPEASTGPLDTSYLFDEFIQVIGGKNNA